MHYEKLGDFREDDHWKVELDIRDLGGRFDTTSGPGRNTCWYDYERNSVHSMALKYVILPTRSCGPGFA